MLIVDLRHWLRPDGTLVPQAKLAPHVALIVECATASLASGLTTMLCRHHDSRRRCAGQLVVTLDDDEIQWSCTQCDEGGLIGGWRGTRWDLSTVESGPDAGDLPVYVPLDELRALRELDFEPSLRAVLASPAQVDAGHTCVTLTETELEGVARAIASALSTGRSRRRHDRVFGRIEQVRLAAQLSRRARAH